MGAGGGGGGGLLIFKLATGRVFPILKSISDYIKKAEAA